jgi:hypothetical protein
MQPIVAADVPHADSDVGDQFGQGISPGRIAGIVSGVLLFVTLLAGLAYRYRDRLRWTTASGVHPRLQSWTNEQRENTDDPSIVSYRSTQFKWEPSGASQIDPPPPRVLPFIEIVTQAPVTFAIPSSSAPWSVSPSSPLPLAPTSTPDHPKMVELPQREPSRPVSLSHGFIPTPEPSSPLHLSRWSHLTVEPAGTGSHASPAEGPSPDRSRPVSSTTFGPPERKSVVRE